MENFDRIQKSMATGSSDYTPTVVLKEKYANVVAGRNRFIKYCGMISVAVGLAYLLPNLILRRSIKRLFVDHCRGRVVDLTPKMTDQAVVDLYESSRAVRVEFLVKEKIFDDAGTYKIDETLPEKEQEDRRRSLTICYLTRNDPSWVGSPVTFDVIEEHNVVSSSYETVLVHHELANLDDEEAATLLRKASDLVSPTGTVLVMEFGKPSVPSLSQFLSLFHARTKSSLHLNRPYDTWVQSKSPLSMKSCHRTLAGSHYSMVFGKN